MLPFSEAETFHPEIHRDESDLTEAIGVQPFPPPGGGSCPPVFGTFKLSVRLLKL